MKDTVESVETVDYYKKYLKYKNKYLEKLASLKNNEQSGGSKTHFKMDEDSDDAFMQLKRIEYTPTQTEVYRSSK